MEAQYSLQRQSSLIDAVKEIATCGEGSYENWLSSDYKYILENKPFAFNALFDEKIRLLTMTEEIEDKLVYQME